jgi:hypothetical protein
VLYPLIISHIQERRHVIAELKKYIDFNVKPVHFPKDLILQNALIYERFNILSQDLLQPLLIKCSHFSGFYLVFIGKNASNIPKIATF